MTKPTKKLSKSQEAMLCAFLVKRYKDFNSVNKPQYQTWRAIEDAFLASNLTNNGGSLNNVNASPSRFSGLVPFLKEAHQTLVSHFWARTLQSENVFFDVEGQDEKAQEFADIHKKNVWNMCSKDKLQTKLDEALFKHAIKKGFCVGRVVYKKAIKKMTMPTKYVNLVKPPLNAVPDPKTGLTTYDQVEYDGASLEIIDPFHFVYDPSEPFDTAFKCLETFKYLSDLKNNKLFTVSASLAPMQQPTDSLDDDIPTRFRSLIRENKINLKEFYGNFTLEGTLYENYYVAIANDTDILCFMENPLCVNPIVIWEYNYGLQSIGCSPLEHAVDLADAASLLMNSGVMSAQLAINPPYLAHKGAFNGKDIKLTEGQIISYEPNPIAPGAMPQPIAINPQAPLPYMQYLEAQIEAVTGATRQLSGNVTTVDKDTTATEFQGLQVVGNLVLDRLVDTFNQKFKLPIIEKMVTIQAIFNPEERQIPVKNAQGVVEIQKVDPQTYFANYSYIIVDSKSEAERKSNLQQKLQLLMQFMQNPILAQKLKIVELASQFLQDFGFGEAGTYFFTEEEFIEDKATTLVEQSIVQKIAEAASEDPQMEQELLQNAQAGNPGVPLPILEQQAAQAAQQMQQAKAQQLLQQGGMTPHGPTGNQPTGNVPNHNGGAPVPPQAQRPQGRTYAPRPTQGM